MKERQRNSIARVVEALLGEVKYYDYYEWSVGELANGKKRLFHIHEGDVRYPLIGTGCMSCYKFPEVPILGKYYKEKRHEHTTLHSSPSGSDKLGS